MAPHVSASQRQESFHDKKIGAELGANGFIEPVKGLFVGTESVEPAAGRIGKHNFSSRDAVDHARGVSKNPGDFESDDPLIVKDLVRLAHTASEYGLYSFAYGANTIGKAISVVRAGTDYACGSAVASTAAVPRPHARFTPLFGDATPRLTELDRSVSLRRHPRFAPMEPNSTVTLPDGQRFHCRAVNVSESGAVGLCNVAVEVGNYLVIGSLPAQIARTTATGFAVRFLEVLMDGGRLLESLRLLAEDQKRVEGRAQ